jgi:exopolysaccharide biosynthesis operon protein EpsL
VAILVKRHDPVLLAGILALLFASSAFALEGDTFRPFVSFSQYYDDNLFRLDDKERINLNRQVMVGPQADSYNVLNFGANVDWRIKRQQVLMRAAKSLVRYSKFDSLNYDGSDYLGQWNWQLGNHWNGQIGATQSQSQSNYTDLNTTIALNNQRTVRNVFGTANWQFHPRWQVGGGVSEVNVINSDVTQLPNDFKEQSEELNLTWTTPKGSSVRTQLRIAKASYPNTPPFASIDNGYSQQELNVFTVWPYSGLLRFQSRIGYQKREHNSLSARNFSGVTGRAAVDYFATGKTRYTLNVYRELGAVSEISSSYRITTGFSLDGLWNITSKLSFNGALSRETADFKGDPRIFTFNFPVRQDKTQNASLGLNYQPLRSTVIGLGLQTGRRVSNDVINQSSYKFNTIFANVRVDF